MSASSKGVANEPPPPLPGRSHRVYRSKVMLALWVGLPGPSPSAGRCLAEYRLDPGRVFTSLLVGSIGGTLASAMLAVSIINERERHVYDLFVIRPVRRRASSSRSSSRCTCASSSRASSRSGSGSSPIPPIRASPTGSPTPDSRPRRSCSSASSRSRARRGSCRRRFAVGPRRGGPGPLWREPARRRRPPPRASLQHERVVPPAPGDRDHRRRSSPVSIRDSSRNGPEPGAERPRYSGRPAVPSGVPFSVSRGRSAGIVRVRRSPEPVRTPRQVAEQRGGKADPGDWGLLMGHQPTDPIVPPETSVLLRQLLAALTRSKTPGTGTGTEGGAHLVG